jgi:8-oxo-dGTP pyrophosphatase MutT (NUDIX family)
MLATKACPIVLRKVGGRGEVLAFEHPRAGLQLVKGTIEPGETPEAAALRELSEESGISAASVTRALGVWASGFEGQVWSFILVQPHIALAESWSHDAPDDGGLRFRFFWHRLDAPLDNEWHPLFREAIRFLQNVA